MTKLQKALHQVGAPEHAEVLGCYFASGRPPGEAAGMLLIEYQRGVKPIYLCGYYEETKGGWDWVTETRNEDKAYAGFVAVVGAPGEQP